MTETTLTTEKMAKIKQDWAEFVKSGFVLMQPAEMKIDGNLTYDIYNVPQKHRKFVEMLMDPKVENYPTPSQFAEVTRDVYEVEIAKLKAEIESLKNNQNQQKNENT